MENMSEQCRLCLSTSVTRTYHPIISEYSNDALRIFLISGVKVIDNRENPSLICQKCSNDLEIAHQIRRKCLDADEFFQKVTIEYGTEVFPRHQHDYIKLEPHGDEYEGIKEECEGVKNIKSESEFDCDLEPQSLVCIKLEKEPKIWKKRQRRFHDTPERVKCPMCTKTYKNEERLLEHTYIVHTESSAECECDICGRKKVNLRSLQQHIQMVHSGAENFSQEKGNPQADLPTAKRKQSHKIRFSCSMCTKTFRYESKLEKHERAHINIAKRANRIKQPKQPAIFLCSFCSKSFKYKFSLHEHELVKHNDEEPKYQCDLCGKKKKTFRRIMNHMVLVHPPLDRRCICPTCGRGFASKSHLTAHEQIHTSETHPCNMCDKIYNTKHACLAHISRVHKRDMKLSCPLDGCNFITYSKTVLTKHKNCVHNMRPKNFACTECPWKFAYRDTLVRHMRVHTGEKPFKCNNDGCDRAFCDKKGIVNHQKSCQYGNHFPT